MSADLESFRSLLSRETGLRFADDKLPFLAELLATRTQRLGTSTEAYLERVLPTPDEMEELARTLSVSETYFLRNRDQFRAFEALLLERAATSRRHLRVLSAGCASGEEAYSVAMLIAETLQHPQEWSIDLVGADWNRDAIDKARTGRYPAWSLRDTPDDLRRKYFDQDGRSFVLSPRIRDMVRFEQQNLARPTPGWWRSESFDFVFCRNMIMYLTPAAARRVVHEIHRALARDGYLFLGHAENLRGLSQGFELEHTHDTFYYRRRSGVRGELAPVSARPSAAPINTSWFDVIQQASQRIERLSQNTANDAPEAMVKPPATPRDLSSALDLMRQERFQDALWLLAGLDEADDEPDALLLRAMLLMSTGDVAGAEQRCRELLAGNDLNAGAHYIMAICREHAGDAAGAVEHSQSAAYLDAEFAMPHVQLGRLARRAGDLATARRELSVALELLPREDSARIILFGGGFGREALMRLCESELDASGGHR